MNEIAQAPTAVLPIVDAYRVVCFPDGGIAFRYDSTRGIIEIQRRGVKYLFDLALVRERNSDG